MAARFARENDLRLTAEPSAIRAAADSRYFFLRVLFFLGTLAPERRASDSPMAMACLRLLTLAPDRPLFSLPRFISCTAFFTLRPLVFPYLRAM